VSIYDQIEQAAKAKKGYVNTKGMARPVVGPKPRFEPKPNLGPVPSLGTGRSAAPAPALKSLEELRAGFSENSGGGDGNPLGAIGRGIAKGFETVLNVADVPRRAYQGVAGEVGDVIEGLTPGDNPIVDFAANVVAGNPFQMRGLADENGERDTSFDPGAIRSSVTAPGAQMQGYLGRSTWDDDLPGWLRPVAGFAGDLATDPLTYVTAGTVKAGSTVLGTASREVLGQTIAKNAITEAGQKVAPKVVDNLIKEVGSRGTGGLTRKALARSGATVDDLVKLGVNPDWGISAGVGSKKFAVPGTRRAAESVANVKGAIKRATGSSRAGHLTRELFTSAEHGEARLKQTLLGGSSDAPSAARGLALLNVAKGDSWAWFDETARRLRSLRDEAGRPLRKFSDDEARTLTLALEANDFSHPLVKEVSQFFETVAGDLQSKGVRFNQRQGYVPHRLSEHAIKLLNEGNEELRGLIDDTIDRPEIFQKLRQSDETIESINARWRQNHDYDLLETDFRVLSAQYMAEGQEAVLKSGLTGKMAEDMGLVQPMGSRVDADKVYADLDKATEFQTEQIAKSVRDRRKSLNKMTKVAKASVATQSKVLTDARAALTKAEGRVAKLVDDAAVAERQLASANEAYDLTQKAANVARGQEKSRLTNRLKQMDVERARLQGQIDSAQTQLASAEKDFGRWTDDVRRAEEDFATYEGNFNELTAERLRMESEPVTSTAVQASNVAEQFSEKAAKAADKFATAQSDIKAAETTASWLSADVNRVADRVEAELAEFTDWENRLAKTRKAGKPTLDSNKALRDSQRELMTDVRNMLRTSTDPQIQDALKLEAQALTHDMAAMRSGMASGRLRDEFTAGVDLLDNPRFQKYIVEQTQTGFERLARNLGPDEQIQSWYKETMERHRQFLDPATRGPAFRALAKGMRGYQKVMNWWKGWALASPGFAFRNWYSGMFGMYLDDALNPKLGARFSRYMTKLQKDPEAARAWALKTFGPEQAERLDTAYKVAAASGWGITSQEMSTSLVGSTVKLNPFSADNPLAFGVRHASSEVEAFLRGGHALAVLERGGSFEDALQRVQKFHFNYRDISDFDRAAKQAMPFWTFWSRNIGLQAQVYARRPDKINRSYINMKRNIEESADPDEGDAVPWYLTNDMMGILTPFGSAAGRGRAYFTPDVPSARFPGQMAQMGDDPLREIMSNLGPGLKIPAQLLANKDMFTGREYRNELTTRDDEGIIPRLAPSPMQLPGVRNVLDQVLPGTELIDNQLLMQDNVQAAVEGINPAIGRLARLVPNNQRQEETYRQYWLNWFGAPVRWNDPGSQAGALASQDQKAQAAADAVQKRIELERLVSGG
jgi:hypothetical protein